MSAQCKTCRTTGPAHRCNGCGTVSYCGAACGALDAANHGPLCALLSQRNDSVAAKPAVLVGAEHTPELVALDAAWLKRCAMAGDREAMVRLGLCAQMGLGGHRLDLHTAAGWFTKAVHTGSAPPPPAACFYLGQCYQYGDGVRVNLEKAAQLYKQGGERGHLGAQWAYGKALSAGRGVPYDPAAAYALFKKGAEEGHPASQNSFAVALRTGHGVAKNSSLGVTYYQLAASAKDPQGMRNLAIVYAKGDGLPMDFYKAQMYIRKAAAAGDWVAAESEYGGGAASAAIVTGPSLFPAPPPPP